MFLSQSSTAAWSQSLRHEAAALVASVALTLRSAGGFLLGGGCAALIVLTFAGASLALSRASVDARTPAFDEFSLHRLPRPSLTLGRIA
jgi:hypothetical protein